MAEIPIQRKERRNIWPMILGLLALLAVLWFMFGRQHDTDTAAVRADSTAVASNGGVTTDSAGGAMANGATGGMAAGAGAMNNGASGTTAANGSTGAGGTMADADIASVIHAVNQGEVAAGKLAETKASNGDVKAFAREMVKEHGAMDAQGSKLSAATGGAAQGAMRDSVASANQAMSSQLQSAGSGAAFDKAYLDAQVTGHQNTLAFLQQAQGQAQNADLKQMIGKAIPDVQKHLDRARALQSKVGR